MNLWFRFAIATITLVCSVSETYSQSAIYACGHIRRTREFAIDNLRSSGYTTAIIFNVSVEEDGTLTTDYNWSKQEAAEAGGIICRNGEYVFDQYQPHYVDDINRLLEPPTSINRLEYCIGGWTNGSYGNIRKLIEQYGTGPETMLYRNFKALKETIPAVTAVNNDQEQDYDAATAIAFHRMLAEIGFKTTIAPYTNMSFWKQLVEALNEEPGTCEIVYLQTYGGGAYNNPTNWMVFGDIPMYVGFDCEANASRSAMDTKFRNWSRLDGVVGGFLWNYNSEDRNHNEWATSINRIFGTRITDTPAIVVHETSNFKGYGAGLPEGSFTQADLAMYGITAQKSGSLTVSEGYKVTLYSEKDLTGESIVYTETTPTLGPEWIDRARSISVESVSGITGVFTDSEQQTARIYDVHGRVAAETTVSGESILPTLPETLPGGIYIVKTAQKAFKIFKKY